MGLPHHHHCRLPIALSYTLRNDDFLPFINAGMCLPTAGGKSDSDEPVTTGAVPFWRSEM
jgi:hypothetical protein